MKALIVDGTWSGNLPGVREVMKHLGVSSKPVQSAIAELEREGLVGPSERGRRRKIIFRELDADRAAGEVLLMREPRSTMSSLSREVYQRLMRLITGMGIKVVEVVGTHDDKKLLKMSRDVAELARGRYVVAFDLEHSEVRDLLGFDREILLIGRKKMEDPRGSFVAIRLGSVFQQIFERLFGLGLDRVTILPSMMSGFLYDVLVDVLSEVYEKAGKKFDVNHVMPKVTPKTMESVIKRLEETPPQVYICMLQDQWAWMVRRFQQQGNKQEVMTLFDDSLFSFFERPPNVCRPVYDDYLSAFSDWYSAMSGGHSPALFREVKCEFVWQR